VARGEHLGYFFQAVSSDGSHHLLQVRQRDFLYRQNEVLARWPISHEHYFSLVCWLAEHLLAEVEAYVERGVIDDYYQPLSDEVLSRIPYDATDGVPTTAPLRWDGARMTLDNLSLYPQDKATVAFVAAIAPGHTLTRENITLSWHRHLMILEEYLRTHPLVRSS
jgi:hypothetical protein